MTAFAHGLLALSSAPPSPMHSLGIGVATFFAGMFGLVGAMTLFYAHARIASKTEYTFPDHLAAQVTDRALVSAQGIVVRANEDELHVVLPAATLVLAPGTMLELSLDLEDGAGALNVRGRIDGIQPSEGGCVVKLALVGLAPAARDRLFDRLVERAMPALVDPLTLSWRDHDGREPAAAMAPYYLPIETTVL
ncbi:MAG: hypothetical protein H0T76_08370 [Nannocystis sp.]|nr:hypothetical protein [Nannocystis sp.]